MGTNSDFLSELLRINGLLQASLTELRYRCEVYRLSLRSICKVLGNVQREQELRLCGLTTSRYSYQTYLQNYSQKQALDRISNVVKKASTFINGYSLVDKELFQPPPPKPKPMSQEKRIPSQTTASYTSSSSSHVTLTHSDSEVNSLAISISANGTSANSEISKRIPDSAVCKFNTSEVVGRRHDTVKHDRKKGSSKRSKSKEKRRHCQTKSRSGSEHSRVKTSAEAKNSTERDEPLTKKQTMSLSVSRQRCQLRNPRHPQNDIRKQLSQQRRNYSSVKSQSQIFSSTERKTCIAHPSKSLRIETRREWPSLERKARVCFTEDQNDVKKSDRAAHLKEIHESCEKRIPYNYKIGENFGARSRTTTQAEKVRRIQVCKASGSQYASRQAMTGFLK